MPQTEGQPGPSRRSLLVGAVAIGGAMAIGGAATARGATVRASDRPDAATPRRVVVIGAGLSGLTTALDLRAAGWEVVVLEARDRVGGRVHTLYDPFDHGLHAEAGGESIDQSHSDIQAMIRRFGLATERRHPLKPYDATVLYQGQRLPLDAFLAQKGAKPLQDYLRFDNAVSALSTGVDPNRPEAAPHASQLDAMSLETFIKAQHLVPEAEFIVRLMNRAEYNAEPRDISMLFVAQQGAASAGGIGGLGLTGVEVRRISGGNSRLPESMATDLGAIIQRGQEVVAVEHRHDGVRVHTTRQVIDAAWLVIAAPLMPMRRVRFTPSLPTAVAACIRGLTLGTAVKVIREYAVPFWQLEGGASGFSVTDLPYAVGWSPTDSQPAAQGGLMSQFITGDAARAAAAMPDARRRAVFGAQLDAVYPEGVPLTTGRGATMAWANERFTGGGYAVFRPRQMAPFWPVLRDGTGRIRFAGEHTSPLVGYMESAIRSGHRAAGQIGQAPR